MIMISPKLQMIKFLIFYVQVSRLTRALLKLPLRCPCKAGTIQCPYPKVHKQSGETAMGEQHGGKDTGIITKRRNTQGILPKNNQMAITMAIGKMTMEIGEMEVVQIIHQKLNGFYLLQEA